MKEFTGWLNVYKPINISSFGVINKIKKKFNLLKLGHAGTLDPLAEGVLPIAIGKTTKLISLINDKIKCYEFEVKWGEETSTDDREGEIIKTSDYVPDKKNIEKKLKDFVGNIKQKPPKASAVKIKGKRAYQRLRNNEKFETSEKPVKVYSLKLINQPKTNISSFKIECGKGFYVRSFARDIGHSFNSSAHVYSLKRTKVGKFTIKNSILLDDLLKISQTPFGIRGFHVSMSMLDDIPAFEIDNEEMLKDISHGKIVKVNFKDLPKPPNSSEDKIYLATKKNEVVSLGRINGIFFEPRKVLV
jgi:tRNA pseudouridine55 synthase